MHPTFVGATASKRAVSLAYEGRKRLSLDDTQGDYVGQGCWDRAAQPRSQHLGSDRDVSRQVDDNCLAKLRRGMCGERTLLFVRATLVIMEVRERL